MEAFGSSLKLNQDSPKLQIIVQQIGGKCDNTSKSWHQYKPQLQNKGEERKCWHKSSLQQQIPRAYWNNCLTRVSMTPKAYSP